MHAKRFLEMPGCLWSVYATIGLLVPLPSISSASERERTIGATRDTAEKSANKKAEEKNVC
jgi:hypothetical protein